MRPAFIFCLFCCLAVMAAFPAAAQKPAGSDQSWCRMPAATKVIINPKSENITYDLTKSQADLNNFDTSTKNPYGNSVHTDVGGLMSGGIQTDYRTQFDGIVDKVAKQTCLWYSAITVNINITPTIYIASNYPKGSCMFNAVMEHEQKHVTVDRRLVNTYAQSIRSALQAEIEKQSIYGPVPNASVEQTQNEMGAKIKKIVDDKMAELTKKRLRQQQLVDSLAEYNRVNTLCNPKKPVPSVSGYISK